ncbi:MAG: acetate kinase [Candidatus Improbicoccus pseudotrichonymphae]|uniref:Acetate kinase n=1 Tax=Candidatus Improbicoccus pseudotrichonymphae TaxID=3033792 RepID=A0AA48HUF2_9FIRM|nr:MAG: acetate kinase [Candidatus Improbicoccus pseudotrichonymphae]
MILVFNFGSSSFKYKIFSLNNDEEIFGGRCYKTCGDSGILIFKTKEKEFRYDVRYGTCKDAFESFKKVFSDNNFSDVLKNVKAIGHRVVHGGNYFKSQAVVINKNVLHKIKELIPLSPLHNRSNLDGILSCIDFFGNIKQVAVFDTSFFSNLPKKAYTYAIPATIAKKHNIRKYGFHGISHKYAYETCLRYLKKKNLKVVSCHLGSGSSIAAIVDGNPIDTSMGLTPLGGLMMSTRCGSLDPSVIIHLKKIESLSSEKVYEILNSQSGILGVSGFSDNIEKVIENYEKNENCKLAVDMFCYKITKYIGSYITVMNGCDAVVFTAGIGENSPFIRKNICESLSIFGVKLKKDNSENEVIVSSSNSKICILNLISDEEKCIYNETKLILNYR